MKSYNKIYSLAVMVAMIIFNGCNPQMIPLKGKYGGNPLEIASTKTTDSLWLNIRQLFVAKGLMVKNIDEKKGLVVSTKTSFIPAYTFEDKDGQLNEPQAWVVLRKAVVKKKEWIPKRIFGQWTIQITETGKGTTMIKVEPFIICTYYPNAFTSVEARGESTGKLEQLIKCTVVNDLK